MSSFFLLWDRTSKTWTSKIARLTHNIPQEILSKVDQLFQPENVPSSQAGINKLSPSCYYCKYGYTQHQPAINLICEITLKGLTLSTKLALLVFSMTNSQARVPMKRYRKNT